jgi:formate transporter
MSYLQPSEIAIQFCKSAHLRNAFSNSKLLVYALLGGAYIALGGLLSLVVVGGMPGIAAANPGITKLLFGSLFPLGLILVVIGGAELFTSDCAVIPFAVLHQQLRVKNVLRIWTIVYFGNFIGALLVAYFFAFQSGILNAQPWHNAAISLAIHKTEGSFWVTFIKGVGANWLVCMAVWLAYAAKSIGGKIVAMWFPVMCFVTFGMEHSIANMFFIPTAMFLGAPIQLQQLFVANLLPATLGNIVGGVVLVSLPYWWMFRQQVQASNTNEPACTTSPESVPSHLMTPSFSNQLN